MKTVKLSEICDIKAGGTPSRAKKEYWSNATISWCKIKDFTGKYLDKTEEKITSIGLENSSAKLFKKGTILFSIFATIGEVTILKINATTNQAIAGIEIISEEVDVDYLYYYLKNMKSNVLKLSRGVAQNNINLGILKNLEIKLYKVEKQRKIANKLDKVQELIDLNQEQINLLDELIKSKFIEMFGDININNKKWREDILKNQITIIGGYAFKSSEFKDKGIPVLRIGNINAGYFRNKDLKFWNEEKNLERYLLYPNDIVISLTGTVGKEDYGNVCILKDDFEKYYLNQRNAKLELENTLNKYFITFALKTPEIKRRLTGVSRGVRQANISNKDIENLKIPIPPIELQNQFAYIVKQIDKQKFNYEKNLEQAQKLMDTLMNQYFN